MSTRGPYVGLCFPILQQVLTAADLAGGRRVIYSQCNEWGRQ